MSTIECLAAIHNNDFMSPKIILERIVNTEHQYL
jgi:hypothetical protein